MKNYNYIISQTYVCKDVKQSSYSPNAFGLETTAMD